MGWLSGTPNWFDKIQADLRPDESQMVRLEKLRKSIRADHNSFYVAYMNCEVIIRKIWWLEYELVNGRIAGKLSSSRPSEKELLKEVFLSYVKFYRKSGRSQRYDDDEEVQEWLNLIDSEEHVTNKILKYCSIDFILELILFDFKRDRYSCFSDDMSYLIDLIDAILKGEPLQFADGEI